MVHNVTSSDDFDNFINTNKLVVIDCTATWCGPCRNIAPHFEKLAKEETTCAFGKLDIDDVEDVAEKLNIRSVPLFLFYKDGKRVDSFSGANKVLLEEKINKLKKRGNKSH